MYQVTVKGRTLVELKEAVNDINEELRGGKTINGLEKNLVKADKFFQDTPVAPAPVSTMHLEEGEEEVPSLYAPSPDPVHVEQVGAAPVLNPTLQSVAPSANGVELDVEGIPWDKRIHAGSKAKVKAGTWRTKKGLDPAVMAQVKAELLQQLHIAANPVAIPALPITPSTPAVAPVAPPVAPVVAAPPVAPVVTAAEVVAAVVAPVAPPVALAPQGGHTLQSFKDNMAMTIGTLITEGKLSQDYVNSLLTHFGVAQIWEVNEAQKEEMFTTFVAHNIIVQVA